MTHNFSKLRLLIFEVESQKLVFPKSIFPTYVCRMCLANRLTFNKYNFPCFFCSLETTR